MSRQWVSLRLLGWFALLVSCVPARGISFSLTMDPWLECASCKRVEGASGLVFQVSDESLGELSAREVLGGYISVSDSSQGAIWGLLLVVEESAAENLVARLPANRWIAAQAGGRAVVVPVEAIGPNLLLNDFKSREDAVEFASGIGVVVEDLPPAE